VVDEVEHELTSRNTWDMCCCNAQIDRAAEPRTGMVHVREQRKKQLASKELEELKCYALVTLDESDAAAPDHYTACGSWTNELVPNLRQACE